MENEEKASNTYKKPKFRSPPYPFIGLGKSLERADELYQQAQHHLVPKHVLASCWGYGMKSSGLLQTLAALKQFGLMRDQGSGEKRKFQLTDEAIRILTDPNSQSNKRVNAIKSAALSPSIYRTIWEKYGVSGVSGSMDTTLISFLTLDMKDDGNAPFSPKAAKEVLEGYKSSISYADLTLSDLLGNENEESDDNKTEAPQINREAGKYEQTISVGDWVQRESNGVFTFSTAQRVRSIQSFNGIDWVFIDGSETGIPLKEAVLQKAGAQSPSPQVTPPTLPLALSKNTSEPLSTSATWKEITDVDEGTVTLILPDAISPESYHDIKDWLDLIMRKAKRRAGVIN